MPTKFTCNRVLPKAGCPRCGKPATYASKTSLGTVIGYYCEDHAAEDPTLVKLTAEELRDAPA